MQDITVFMKDEALLQLPQVTVRWHCCTTEGFFMSKWNNISSFFNFLTHFTNMCVFASYAL